MAPRYQVEIGQQAPDGLVVTSRQGRTHPPRSWQLPATVEPLFQNLGASVHVTPVMNGEDLQRGFKEAGM